MTEVSQAERENYYKNLAQCRRRDGIAVASTPVITPIPPQIIYQPLDDARIDPENDSKPDLPRIADTIRLYPGMGLAAIDGKRSFTSQYQLWLLLTAVSGGKGWVLRSDIDRVFGDGGACQIRSNSTITRLLDEGTNLFWSRSDNRMGQRVVWLQSAVNVAAAMGMDCLRGKPVIVPISKIVTRSVKSFRSAVYAAFHAGRRSHKPIKRDTLNQLTGRSSRTLLRYEKSTGIEVERNIVIGDPLNDANRHDALFDHLGQGAYVHKDKWGKLGQPGGEYIAYHQPNSYSPPTAYEPVTSGKQRAINKRLVVLSSIGLKELSSIDIHNSGNGNRVIEQCFYDDAAQAVSDFNRDVKPERIYPRNIPTRGNVQLWSSIGGQG